MSRALRRFRPGLALTLAWAAATAVLLALGAWQVQRLVWKTELIAKAAAAATAAPGPLPAEIAEPAALEFLRVRVSGAYLSGRAVALGLITRDGRAGSRLLAPFRLEDGRTLLVDRGFVPEDRLPEALAAAPPEGLRVLSGVVRAASTGTWATPRPELVLPRWYAPDIGAIGRHLGLALEPVFLVLEQPEPGTRGFPEPAPIAVELPNPHLGYALTWFGLAGVLLAFYILLGVRAGREEGR
ncbi:MAG: SURF1 family protein [Geminicoccaceae bacterium]|nr:SURF1 family protein [Geminicoccaceae bacterium]